MAANTSPIFPGGPNCGQVQAVTANTNRDGTGTLATLWTPGTNGSLLTKVIVTVPGTSLVDVIRLFWYDGANTRLYQEILVPAITPSTTLAVARVEFIPDTPEVWPTGWVLKCSTHIGQTTNLVALGGSY